MRLLLKCCLDARHSPGAPPAEMGFAGRGLSLAKPERQDPRAATAAGRTSQGAVQGRAPGAGRRPPFPSTPLRSGSGGRPRNQLHLLADTVNAEHPRRAEAAGSAWLWEHGELNQVEKTAAFVLAALCGKDAGGGG